MGGRQSLGSRVIESQKEKCTKVSEMMNLFCAQTTTKVFTKMYNIKL